MRFTRAEVGEWLGDRQDQHPAPPFLLVDRSGEDRLAEEPGVMVHGYSDGPEGRRSGIDPGCFRFTFDTSRLEELGRLGDADQPLDAVADYLTSQWGTDMRTIVAETGGPSGGPDDVVPGVDRPQRVPQVRLPDRAAPIDVIGSGGRLALYREQGEIRGRVTMRPVTVEATPVTWRSAESILTELALVFSNEADVTAQFGYFEEPWLERQEIIRPVFLLAVESRDPDEGDTRAEIILRATAGNREEPDRPLVEDSVF
jgi:hypothetical protein